MKTFETILSYFKPAQAVAVLAILFIITYAFLFFDCSKFFE